MKNFFRNKSFTWIHIENPTINELKEVYKDMDVPISVLEDVKSPTQESVCYKYPSGDVYVVVHMNVEQNSDVEEYDFLVTKNGVLTVLYSPSQLFQGIMKRLEVYSMVNKDSKKGDETIFSPWGFVFYLLSEIYRTALHRSFELQKKLKSATKGSKNKKAIFDISKIVQESLILKSSINTHSKYLEKISEEALNSDPKLESSIKHLNLFFKTVEIEVIKAYTYADSVFSMNKYDNVKKSDRLFHTLDVVFIIIYGVSYLFSSQSKQITITLIAILIGYILLRYKKYI